MEFAGGKFWHKISIYIWIYIYTSLLELKIFNLVFGNMSGVLIAAFIAYFLGFVGPFAFCGKLFNLDYKNIGIVFMIYGVFQSFLVKFVNIDPSKESMMRHNSSFMSWV